MGVIRFLPFVIIVGFCLTLFRIKLNIMITNMSAYIHSKMKEKKKYKRDRRDFFIIMRVISREVELNL